MSTRYRQTRRTVVRTIGSLGLAAIAGAGAASGADGSAAESDERSASSAITHEPDGPTRYIAVVDRIVDGEHVVLLLEKHGDLVAQHVEPRSSFERVAESDILTVVIDGDELVSAQQLPGRPGSGSSPSPASTADLEADSRRD